MSHPKHSQKRRTPLVGRPSGILGGNIQRCSRKKAYDKRVALKVASKVRRNTGEDVRHYVCPDCGAWHIGHPPGSKAAEMTNQED